MPMDTIATYAETEYFFSRRSPTFLDVPLGRATRVAVRLQEVVVASTDSTTMHVLSLNGAPVAQWPLGLTRRHASLDDQRRAFEERLEALQLLRTRRMLRLLLEELPRVDQFPYFETLVTWMSPSGSPQSMSAAVWGVGSLGMDSPENEVGRASCPRPESATELLHAPCLR